MPTNKDLKRLVRARMAKTGESYTAALAHLREEEAAPPEAAPPEAAPPEAAPALPPDHEALAGQTDETMVKRTGRTWAEWLVTIDAFGGRELDHTAIARQVKELISDEYGWWAQTVTVGYERLIGRRQVGMSCDGDFQASKSKTLRSPRPLVFATLRRLAEDPDWCGPLDFHGATEPKSVRFRQGEARVSLWLSDKGADRCTVSVNHTGLASKDDVADAKEAWAVRLSLLAEAL